MATLGQQDAERNLRCFAVSNGCQEIGPRKPLQRSQRPVPAIRPADCRVEGERVNRAGGQAAGDAGVPSIAITAVIRENPLSMGLGRPVSRILLYPVIHLRCSDVLTHPYTGPPGEPRLPARRGVSRNAPTGQFGLLAPVVYLAGPSRDTAGGLLPHPFTHHL